MNRRKKHKNQEHNAKVREVTAAAASTVSVRPPLSTRAAPAGSTQAGNPSYGSYQHPQPSFGHEEPILQRPPTRRESMWA